jgi:hypothetical protein
VVICHINLARRSIAEHVLPRLTSKIMTIPYAKDMADSYSAFFLPSAKHCYN